MLADFPETYYFIIVKTGWTVIAKTEVKFEI